MRDNRRGSIRPLLLRELFVASIPILLVSLIAWPLSEDDSAWASRGDVDLRLHRGCLCLTVWNGGGGAHPWPSVGVPRVSHADGRSYVDYGDPDDASILGFNAISLPEFDLFAVPFWPIVLGCVCYQVWWIKHGRHRHWRRFAAGCCQQCGYNLQGLFDSPRCPECGERFRSGKVAPVPASAATERARRHGQSHVS